MLVSHFFKKIDKEKYLLCNKIMEYLIICDVSNSDFSKQLLTNQQLLANLSLIKLLSNPDTSIQILANQDIIKLLLDPDVSKELLAILNKLLSDQKTSKQLLVNLNKLLSVWERLISLSNIISETKSDNEAYTKNLSNYERWFRLTADAISVYDPEYNTHITGFLGRILQAKLRDTASEKEPSWGIKIRTSEPVQNEITSDVAKIWLEKLPVNQDASTTDNFRARLMVEDFKFNINIEYLGGYFSTVINNVNNKFAIEYDWIERKYAYSYNTQYFSGLKNISQYPSNDPKYMGSNLISTDYDFPLIGKPDWWRADLWVLYPVLLILQTTLYGIIRLFIGDVISNNIRDGLNTKDFEALFKVFRNREDCKPIYI